MTNRETIFLERWRAEKHAYLAWGNRVVAHLLQALRQSLDSHQAAAFVRIRPEPRLKEEDSLLQKAFHRGKNYGDPYEDIEDKVGVRFVVLLEQDVRLVGSLIDQEREIWNAVRARDHEAEIAADPFHFGYQSLHFVVRSKNGQSFDGTPVPDGLPCEVQVRTLLQHAYSEVTHDTLYKPTVQTTPQMKRAAAKSIALIEATGDYFSQLDALITAQVAPLRKLNDTLRLRYAEIVGMQPEAEDSPLNDLLLDRYGHGVDPETLNAWLERHNFIGQRIASRHAAQTIYRLPSILLVYYLASVAPHGTRTASPIGDPDLSMIYSDVGESLDG